MTESAFKSRADVHLARKVWHVLGVLFILVLHLELTPNQALKVASVMAFLFVGNDLLRKAFPPLNRALLSVFGNLMREDEKEGMAGTSALLLGVLVLIYFYPRDVVTLALVFLGLADPIASFIGIRYGKDKIIGSKSLQGSLAAFGVCALSAGLFFSIKGIMTERLLIVSLLSGLIGAISELVPIWKLDDNFTFPVLSATLLWLLISLFGGL